jgi:anti-anti-sigma factor
MSLAYGMGSMSLKASLDLPSVAHPTMTIHLSGDLTLGPDLFAVRDQVYRWIENLEDQKHTIVADLDGVTKVDSAGIGELTAWYTRAAKYGCRLLLQAPSRQLQRILEISGLNRILQTL